MHLKEIHRRSILQSVLVVIWSQTNTDSGIGEHAR